MESHNGKERKAPKGPAKRTAAERERDEPFIASLYLRGLTHWGIAEELNKRRPYALTRSAITRDLQRIRKHWLASSLRDFDEAKAQELAKIDHVEAEAWAAWERSKESQVSTKTRREEGKEAKTSAERTETQRVGDPRWLQVVDSCIAHRIRLLGLSAPSQLELAGPGGGPIPHAHAHASLRDMDTLTDEQLEAIIANDA